MDKSLALLQDILEACDRINGYTTGLDLKSWENDHKTQDAVEHNFDRIGEALNRLDRHDPSLAGKIPEMVRIIDFRNFLTHQYDDVDPLIVWNHIQNKFPVLHATIRSLVDELDPQQDPIGDSEPDPTPPSFGPGM